MDFNKFVYPRKLYQDTRNSNPLWRQADRIFQPLTERQFRNRFKVGDRVVLRLITPTSKMYISARITYIVTYQNTLAFAGPYNIDSALNNIPFTHVLVLGP
jgi:hypothetical protein